MHVLVASFTNEILRILVNINKPIASGLRFHSLTKKMMSVMLKKGNTKFNTH